MSEKKTSDFTLRKQGQGCNVTGPELDSELLLPTRTVAWPRVPGPVLLLLFHSTYACFHREVWK